jgi:hypothetical protein
MDRTKRNFILELIGFFCSLAIVFTSASTMLGKVNRPELIGLIAGSFGAGATLVNAIRNRASGRKAREMKIDGD